MRCARKVLNSLWLEDRIGIFLANIRASCKADCTRASASDPGIIGSSWSMVETKSNDLINVAVRSSIGPTGSIKPDAMYG